MVSIDLGVNYNVYESKTVVTRTQGEEKLEDVGKILQNFSYVRRKSSGDVIFSTVTRGSIIVLYTRNL